jgi:NAD-dependent deacetylase
MLYSQISDLAKLITNANYVIAFTGAGISTESRIPDFRSRGEGLLEKTK